MYFLFLTIISIFLAISVICLAIMILFSDSKNKDGELGINFDLPNCPKCKQEVLASQKPTSARQFLWGDRTCQFCGSEMDKWGNNLYEENRIFTSRDINDKIEILTKNDGKTPLERIIDDNNT